MTIGQTPSPGASSSSAATTANPPPPAQPSTTDELRSIHTELIDIRTDIETFAELEATFFERLKGNFSKFNSLLQGMLETSTPNVTHSLDNQSDIQPPPQIPIQWPSDSLTQNWVISLMETFDWASKNLPPSEFPTLLPVEVFDELVRCASEILIKEPNIIRVDGLDTDSRVVVVGDIHGQLHDLIFLLHDAGFLSDNRVFVFNGDYVDRGAWGLETFLLLLAWKVSMPKKVYLLRGNHESKYCTSTYGFKKEVEAKYGDKGEDVYGKCLNCFKRLPLASVIGGHIYTAHGGLFRPTRTRGKKTRGKKTRYETSSLVLGSLDDLSKAKREVVNPEESSNLILGDVLWSDPAMSPGLSPNTERGVGLLWGPDCTEEFLKKSNLKRTGLEGMDEGYTIDHVVESGKLITVFSAPDYPQFQAPEEKRYNNKGAYIVLEPPHFDCPVFHSFGAVTPRPEANPYYDYENVPDSDEDLDLTVHDSDEDLDLTSMVSQSS
ncbi:hypothetical protein RHMOL_Rhmol12G0013800 [Rhododendron molle]|uniref:Uncharacterized protein n=3 Tax=Rhododendron molle TaxID=49168 RepID=A0ACC0LE59_RHOML|nr:hypothetical protein RHMOL_Rhmol12G0013800 [Rhododendron molle]KAI8526669.1 hypothetical protein RHMOL_Rhmol12G0013800 [Rhododendron molle]KAI8526670.1 hypothetical protein RHMOL_Rhmol12G0013800 [Rhododendron molle]